MALMQDEVRKITERIQQLYLDDEIPWVVGYSGGKDSTATLQLVWNAVKELPANKRTKPIHVISTDTLVENPVVALWVNQSLKQMQQAIDDSEIPFHPHRLTPKVKDRFWVNLIGKGYPAPRPKFRWCTSRLKISPSNTFITDVVKSNGEAILVLGTRKSESSTRQANMKKYEKSTRQYLSRNADPSLDRTWVFTPVAEWSSDDIWEYLVTYDNPWSYDNKMLLNMYRGATKDNECPLVVDSSTPSCGDSRFGCYVCTMVTEDKSMAAMIQNDDEKEWMKPLLDFRNKWLNTDDRDHRDFRRMNGSLTVYRERLVHGPYKQSFREKLLEELLLAQVELQKHALEEIEGLELLSLEDLEEIRRIWVMDKHEIEDTLPQIYKRALGKPYPSSKRMGYQPFGVNELQLLQDICKEQGDDEGIHFQLARKVLHIEQQHRTMVRRSGLYDALEKALVGGAFNSSSEAEKFAVQRDNELKKIRDLSIEELSYSNLKATTGN